MYISYESTVKRDSRPLADILNVAFVITNDSISFLERTYFIPSTKFIVISSDLDSLCSLKSFLMENTINAETTKVKKSIVNKVSLLTTVVKYPPIPAPSPAIMPQLEKKITFASAR